MFSNYLKTAIRFFAKNRTFGLINIIGLATGTVCCLYILLYVQDQYSFDKHHHNADKIYRITSLLKSPGDKESLMATCSPPVAPAMKNDISEVMQYTRVVGTIGVNQHLLRFNDKSFYEKDAVFADSTFFDVFTYHFIYGNAAQALQEPYSLVLLKGTAGKLFGNIDPVGKRITIDNAYGKHDFLVTGVVDESLGKSHISANLFIAMNSGGIGDYVRSNNSWDGQNFTNSYVKLHATTTAAAVEKKLPAFLDKYGREQLKNAGRQKELHLQAITTIHNTPGYEAEIGKVVSPTFLSVLLLIAVLIQLIACINFMNLSTANASKRAKDVGVRKVIGAEKIDLIKQFIGESVLLSTFAVLLSIPLLGMALPYLSQITNTVIPFSVLANWRMIGLLVSFVLITGLLAGSYPAFYLSSFAAVKVIKGNFTSHISAAGIRKSLVVFQFVLSICLITGILVIFYQLKYISNKDIGFEKKQRLIFSFHTQETKKQIAAFATGLQSLAEVKDISRTNNYPSQFVYNDIGLFLSGGSMNTAVGTQFMVTDEHFIEATGIKLLTGNNFHRKDANKVLVNEAYLKASGLTTQNAIGAKLFSGNGGDHPFEIAGVIKDFNYNSLHEAVRPFMLVMNDDEAQLSHLVVAVNSDNYANILKRMEGVWRRYFPATPFEYHFLDEQIQQQYQAEITLGRIINTFATMAILISCLGLFGLSAFTAEQRKKEIGIRKVLGADALGLTNLLSRDFLKLVLIAIVIATPISWWAARQWLEAFVYRFELTGWIFATAGGLAMLIALLTVSFHALRAAFANPVKNLRTE